MISAITAAVPASVPDFYHLAINAIHPETAEFTTAGATIAMILAYLIIGFFCMMFADECRDLDLDGRQLAGAWLFWPIVTVVGLVRLLAGAAKGLWSLL